MVHKFSERLARLESGLAEAVKFSDAEAVRAQQTEALVTSLLAFKDSQAALSAQFDGAFAAFHSLLTEAGLPLPHHWHQLQSHLHQLLQPSQRGQPQAALMELGPRATPEGFAGRPVGGQKVQVVPVLALPANEDSASAARLRASRQAADQGEAESEADELSDEEASSASDRDSPEHAQDEERGACEAVRPLPASSSSWLV